MKHPFLLAAFLVAPILSPVVAIADDDIEEGKGDFKKCKSCHTIASADEVIYKGGRTGPNLYGIVGRTAGSLDGFKYGASIVAAGEAGLVWTEELLIDYIADPKTFLKDITGDAAAKSKMTFKLKDPEDVAAYLASVSPDAPQDDDS